MTARRRAGHSPSRRPRPSPSRSTPRPRRGRDPGPRPAGVARPQIAAGGVAPVVGTRGGPAPGSSSPVVRAAVVLAAVVELALLPVPAAVVAPVALAAIPVAVVIVPIGHRLLLTAFSVSCAATAGPGWSVDAAHVEKPVAGPLGSDLRGRLGDRPPGPRHSPHPTSRWRERPSVIVAARGVDSPATIDGGCT